MTSVELVYGEDDESQSGSDDDELQAWKVVKWTSYLLATAAVWAVDINQFWGIGSV